MEDRIIIIATLKLVEGRLEELLNTVKELQSHCLKTEHSMLQYDWYVSESSNTIKVLETYSNSEAVLFHFDNLESFKANLGESRTFVSLEVFGNASKDLKERVKKINAEHFTAISYLNTTN